MRKALIITYYWPPSGGAGVQRWLKFSKYLPQFGWQPVIFAPEGAEYPILDPTLGDEVRDDIEVIRYPIREPRRWFKFFAREEKVNSGGRKDHLDKIWSIPKQQQSLKQRVAVWLRSNLLIPDARALWIGPSARFIWGYLKHHDIDLIISNGPPHSAHVIALKVVQRQKVMWLADFRDPWTQIDFFDKLNISKWAMHRHQALEKQVLQAADRVTTVSPAWAEMLGVLAGRKIEVVYNGYDEGDFHADKDRHQPSSETFPISYLGTMSLDRSPASLWEAISELATKVNDFGQMYDIWFAGNIDRNIFAALENAGLRYKDLGYLPHDEAVSMMQKSAVLLLIQNKVGGEHGELIQKGVIPGKVFEYLASGSVVLFIGDLDSDLASILREFDTAYLSDYSHKMLTQQLSAIFELYRNGKLPAGAGDGLKAFSRESQCQRMVSVMNSMFANGSKEDPGDPLVS